MFHISCETGFGLEDLREYLFDNAVERPWMYDPTMVSDKSPVQRAEELMKQAVFEMYFKELPHTIGIQVVGWVPKLSGELRIDF